MLKTQTRKINEEVFIARDMSEFISSEGWIRFFIFLSALKEEGNLPYLIEKYPVKSSILNWVEENILSLTYTDYLRIFAPNYIADPLQCSRILRANKIGRPADCLKHILATKKSIYGSNWQKTLPQKYSAYLNNCKAEIIDPLNQLEFSELAIACYCLKLDNKKALSSKHFSKKNMPSLNLFGSTVGRHFFSSLVLGNSIRTRPNKHARVAIVGADYDFITDWQTDSSTCSVLTHFFAFDSEATSYHSKNCPDINSHFFDVEQFHSVWEHGYSSILFLGNTASKYCSKILQTHSQTKNTVTEIVCMDFASQLKKIETFIPYYYVQKIKLSVATDNYGHSELVELWIFTHQCRRKHIKSHRNVTLQKRKIRNVRYSRRYDLQLSFHQGEKARYMVFPVPAAPSRATRTSRKKLKLTPEITVHYTLSACKNNKRLLRVEAFIVNYTVNAKGKKMNSSRAFTSVPDENAAVEWLKTEYPFKIRVGRGNNADTDIHSILSNHYRIVLAGKDISLSTALYIYYKHIQSRLSEDDYKLLIDTLSVKVLADLPLSTSLDTFEDTLAALYSEESDRKFNKRLKGLQTLYNVCIEKDHCSKNTISLILHFAKSLNNRRHQVNAALKKNSLVTKEFQKAFNWAKHNAKRHPKYLGILIMLLTGIRSNEVCALRWCDLYENRYGFYSFLIYHEYKNNKMEAIDANRIRRVPCISLLSSVLLAHRPPNTEHYSENFILEKDEKCITPEMLSAAAKELIEYLKINTEILVTLAPNSKNFDLSSFRAVDLIRNNFRYWFSTLCKGNVSECAYVLGVHNPLTVGRHYIDYASEEVQYIIYKKLQRLVPDLLNLHNCWDTFTFLIDNANNYTIESKGSGPSNCTLRLKALEPSTKITVTAPHGFNFVVTNIINIERK